MRLAARSWWPIATIGIALLGIAGAVLLSDWLNHKQSDGIPTPDAAGANAPPIRFTDVTDQAGIRFRHVSGASGKKLLPETMGVGVAVVDFDGDGLPDLFFVNSRPWPGQSTSGRPTQALYRNRGDGTFEDVTQAVGLDVELYGLGVAVGDYDNDGRPDLLITAVGGNRLFHNVEGKRFEDVTVAAGLGEPMPWPSLPFDDFLKHADPISFPSSAAFVDYDGDGLLDIFICNYVTWSPAADVATQAVLPGGSRAYVPPQQFAGANCTLYRNLGGGKFADVSAAAGVQVFNAGDRNGGKQPAGKALGVIVCDLDDDGWPDLVVANDTVRNFYFRNVADPNGGRRFREEAQLAGLAYADGRPRGGMGIDFAEVLPDQLAIVIANFSSEPNSLFRRLGTSPVRFADTAPDVGLASASRYPMKFGAVFFDCDLDGRPDLFIANGHLEPDIAIAQPGQSHAQRGQLFWNSGDPKSLFVPIEGELFPPMVGRGCAYLDFDGDGVLDLVVTDNNGRARLFRNDTATTNRSIRLMLRGTGKTTNRDAIGASIEVEAAGIVHRWYVTPARGYLSQSELTATIGLGAAAKIDRVTVRWPGSQAKKQEWQNLEPGRTYLLVEGEAEAQGSAKR
jgi:enediyne biosynthesis protein E4